MKHTVYMETFLGTIGISEENQFITELFFEKDTIEDRSEEKTPLLVEAEKQILAYLSGERKSFDLPLAAKGTDYQKTVWKALCEIPYGETRSYKEVAEMIGKKQAFRAVGQANNKNPILILIPCHRVVGANGNLVGYAAGLDIKKKLLELEQTHSCVSDKNK